MFASLSLGVTFLKIFAEWGQFVRGRKRAILKSAVFFLGCFCIEKKRH
ncbi:Hypothetical protein AJF4211_000870 [Avibacterium paragallinarum JF4211]|nr:Hypothetical protein AJF4211_000870 [Avibacterium paragallinarum JF4211]